MKAFDYLGLHRYSLTFCTDRRQPLFTTQAVVDLVLPLAVAQYILENPIRKGSVSRVEDYPFLGSLVYSLADLSTAIALMSG